MGICVSTRDFNDVGCTVRRGLPSIESTVEGGDEMSLLNVDGVALDSGSKEKPLVENCAGLKVAWFGESPFIVIPLNVSSSPDEGEFLDQGDCPWVVGSIALRGDASREAPKKNCGWPAGSRGEGPVFWLMALKLVRLKTCMPGADLLCCSEAASKPLGVLAAVSKSKSDAICSLLASKSLSIPFMLASTNMSSPEGIERPPIPDVFQSDCSPSCVAAGAIPELAEILRLWLTVASSEDELRVDPSELRGDLAVLAAILSSLIVCSS